MNYRGERTALATSELAGEQSDLATAARAMWAWASNPQRRAVFNLFFAVYGSALQDSCSTYSPARTPPGYRRPPSTSSMLSIIAFCDARPDHG